MRTYAGLASTKVIDEPAATFPVLERAIVNQHSGGMLVPVDRQNHEVLERVLSHPRFEIVPIKSAAEQARHLPAGATVTITSSPSRGIENTIQVAAQLAKLGFAVVPHIAARQLTDERHLGALLQQLSDLHVREIFVIGGDAKVPAGPFAGAAELLPVLARLTPDLEAIGIAAYPEGHPFIDDRSLLQALLVKQPFATYMVTQICFDPGVIVRWLADMRRRGVELPAYVGLPGVVSMKHLLQISMKIGVGDSLRFLSKNSSLVAGLFERSGHHPGDLVDYLAPYLENPTYNIRGFHFNTFNQVESTEAWRQEMLEDVKKA